MNLHEQKEKVKASNEKFSKKCRISPLFRIGVELWYDRVEYVLHPDGGDVLLGPVVVLVHVLEPADVVVRVRDQVDVQVPRLRLRAAVVPTWVFIEKKTIRRKIEQVQQ